MCGEPSAEVLLEQGSQGSLEPARRPVDEHAEVGGAKDASPNRSQGRYRHPVGSEVQHRQTRANGAPQLRSGRRRRQDKRRQRRGQRSFDPSDRSGRAKCTTLVQVGPPSIERAPAGVSIDSALDDLSPDNNWICL